MNVRMVVSQSLLAVANCCRSKWHWNIGLPHTVVGKEIMLPLTCCQCKPFSPPKYVLFLEDAVKKSVLEK